MPRGMTGAFPAPRHKLAAAVPFRPTAPAPACWGVVAPLYRMWGNDQYGCCVSAEEAANIANYCAAAGIPGHVLTDAEVIAWARKHGFLNGAYLEEVMDALQQSARSGLLGGASAHFVGPYRAVDWHDHAALCAAIYESRAQVNIGIASSGLNDQPGDSNGWIVLSADKSRSIDHCVGLCGYGTLADCCRMCGVSVPGGADANRQCYLLYTWGTVGIVSEEALWAMCGEAWVRLPSSIAEPAYPPTPPGPGPGPIPPLPWPPAPPTPPAPFDWRAFLAEIIAWLLKLLSRLPPKGPKP